LSDCPVIEFDDGSVRVLARNTDDIDVTSINILLDGDFTSHCVYDKITNCVISTTALLLQFTRVNRSTKSSMRVGKELNTCGGSNVQSSSICILNGDWSMDRTLYLSDQSSSTISCLLDLVVIVRNSASSKISAHDTESLFITSINILSDLKSLSSINSHSAGICSSASDWFWVALGKVSAISRVDIAEHARAKSKFGQSHILRRSCINLSGIVDSTNSWIKVAFESRGTIDTSTQCGSAINLLSNSDLAGNCMLVIGSITIIALITNGNIWITSHLSLTDSESPW
jgi:hypothetical protein